VGREVGVFLLGMGGLPQYITGRAAIGTGRNRRTHPPPLNHFAQHFKSFRILKVSGVQIEVPVLSGAILSILLSTLALMSLLEAIRIICYEVE